MAEGDDTYKAFGAEFVGTGRANFTGGGATVTVPKDAAEDVFNLRDGGVDVAYFVDDGKLIMVPRDMVTLK